VSLFNRFRTGIKNNKAGFFINNSARVLRDYLRYLSNRNKVRLFSGKNIKIIDRNNKSSDFFGYYDISPFNPRDNNIILFHSVNRPSFGKYDAEHACQICTYNQKTRERKIWGVTKAWNWQQGARLGWVDDKSFIYNLYTHDQYKACIIDTSTGSAKLLKQPVMAWYQSEYYCSIDYKNLYQHNRDYGYNAHPLNSPVDKSLSINTFSDKNIFTLHAKQALSNAIGEFTDEMYRTSFFNHPIFSPDGSKMIFLFRYFKDNQKVHNLLLWDKDSNTYSQIFNELVSHYTWLSNTELLYWGENQDNDKGYHILNVITSEIKTVSTNLPDGHPSIINESSFITDSYNNDSSGRSISIIGLSSNKQLLYKISEFPTWSYLTRCDPHPSVSKDGEKVQIDLLLDRYRKVGIFEL